MGSITVYGVFVLWLKNVRVLELGEPRTTGKWASHRKIIERGGISKYGRGAQKYFTMAPSKATAVCTLAFSFFSFYFPPENISDSYDTGNAGPYLEKTKRTSRY